MQDQNETGETRGPSFLQLLRVALNCIEFLNEGIDVPLPSQVVCFSFVPHPQSKSIRSFFVCQNKPDNFN